MFANINMKRNRFLYTSMCTFLALYFGLSMLLLPMNDFSLLSNLPSMYKTCKATEDENLTVFTFITEHLVDVDDFFEDEADRMHEKPHKQHYQPVQQVVFTPAKCEVLVAEPKVDTIKTTYIIKNHTYWYVTYLSVLLKPPIA